jgi:hypothetical protein
MSSAFVESRRIALEKYLQVIIVRCSCVEVFEGLTAEPC